MISAWQIFTSFAKIGALLFGGGYTMLPLLEREIVDRRAWCRQDEMLDYYAMAQLVPGVIAINTSLLIGQKLRGWTGAFASMLGVVSVPFITILIYALAVDTLKNSAWLSDALAGIRPAAAGMLLGTAWTMFVKAAKVPLALIIAIAVFALVFICGADTVLVIASGIASGLIWWGIDTLRKPHKRKLKK